MHSIRKKGFGIPFVKGHTIFHDRNVLWHFEIKLEVGYRVQLLEIMDC